MNSIVTYASMLSYVNLRHILFYPQIMADSGLHCPGSVTAQPKTVYSAVRDPLSLFKQV